LFFGHAHQKGVTGNARVIDKDVNGTKSGHDIFYELLCLIKIRSIRAETFCYTTVGSELSLECTRFFFRRKIGKCNSCTLLNARFCNGFSDAA
jgi:hypothetical protein